MAVKNIISKLKISFDDNSIFLKRKKLFDYVSDLHLKISAVTLDRRLVCFMNA